MTDPVSDRRHMAQALALGRRGQGRTWPNPWVGAVVVASGRIVGRGWTQDGGRPHAEVIALAQAGALAKGATVYVTLEPCSHHGKSPPCAQALIDAGVGRVVVATGDPNPAVNGQGIAMLRAAGIAVEIGVMADEASQAHAGFFNVVAQQRPWITLKLATSFDGRIATATGESRWITGPEARRHVHAARLSHDGVLVGGGTARADNPDLRVRDMGATHQPVRIVAVRHLNLPKPLKLLETASTQAPVWFVHGAEEGDVPAATRARFDRQGVTLLPAPIGFGGQLDPLGLVTTLAKAGLTRVFCEGGGALAASLLAAEVVDELIGFTAGLALGAEGRPALGALGVDRLDTAPRFALVETRAAGGDVMHRWHRA
ncbi:MAG: bifunctional diaminohydroxyphosphoribosylaminopyrimidine deaminase/5-amino-6-(5-phosphoribosylamino)uracil reductase RibD [Pseudomonadota bacterium]